ncbi:MAG: S9 family peptidase [Ketobacter sp.]|nr:S9 family peptidase [Ketobacter sp.]
MISRQDLFGNPQRASAQISPSGELCAYLAPLNNILNIWVGPITDLRAAQPVTCETTRDITHFNWAYTNEHIIYLSDTLGDENWCLHGVSVSDRIVRRLTPSQDVSARLVALGSQDPNTLLIGLNERDARIHDLFYLDLYTGERQLCFRNEDYCQFFCDAKLRLKIAVRMQANSAKQYYFVHLDGKLELIGSIPAADMMASRILGVDADGQILYLADSRGRNTAALTAIDMESNNRHVLAEDMRSDVGNVLMHPATGRAQAAAFTYLRRRWETLDETITTDFEYLNFLAEGEFDITSRSLDDNHWLVEYVSDEAPRRYFWYDRNEHHARLLFVSRKSLQSAELRSMSPVVVPTRDGLQMPSYLTLPGKYENGRPHAPIPMVLLVHGGPWTRVEWGFDAQHQWLADRGYAVLSVNYRGSTGLGKQFVNAGDREWAGKMHDDLIDAVRWSIREGIANPDKIAIMGRSYGGYATLVALTLSPDTFACGIDIVGPSNLVTLFQSIPRYWEPEIAMFIKRVGNFYTPEGRKKLLSRSPITHIDCIKRPLLVAHGKNDPRVKKSESDMVIEAARSKGLSVVYVLFPDEGHGFVQADNRMAFNAVTEAFLAKHLGGLLEPPGDELSQTSMQIPVGSEHLPSITAALKYSG